MTARINQTIERLFAEIAELFDGYEVYAVGGFPRDIVMGREVTDLDFATSATPDEIEAILRARCGSHIFDVGKRFGTLGCVADVLIPSLPCDFHLEFTTYRTDKYDGKSRKPQVQFVRTLKEDLIRRDFTINALAMDLVSLEIIDYFNGLKHINENILQTPMDADKTFADDPLRMIRAIRFISQLGFRVDDKTFAAIRENADKISNVAIERASVELDKMIMGEYVGTALRTLVGSRLAQYIIPEILPMVSLNQDRIYHMKDVFEHTISVVEGVPASELDIRWAAFLHDIGKPATITYDEDNDRIHFYRHEAIGAEMAKDILIRMKYSNERINKITGLISFHMRGMHTQSTRAVRRLCADLQEAELNLEDLLILGEADVTSSHPTRIEEGRALITNIREMHKELQNAHEDVIVLPVDGHDVMDMLNIQPSREVGFILDGLKELVIAELLSVHDEAMAKEYVRLLHDEYVIGTELKMLESENFLAEISEKIQG